MRTPKFGAYTYTKNLVKDPEWADLQAAGQLVFTGEYAQLKGHLVKTWQDGGPEPSAVLADMLQAIKNGMIDTVVMCAPKNLEPTDEEVGKYKTILDAGAELHFVPGYGMDPEAVEGFSQGLAAAHSAVRKR